MKCVPCIRELHDSCNKPECECATNAHAQNKNAQPGLDGDVSTQGLDEENPDYARGNQRRTRSFKADAALKDQQSTGRKRAAREYPLLSLTGQSIESSRDFPHDDRAYCEWRFGIKCGGGDSPIQGCVDGRQYARHHGPDKNTLNNDEGNVHRICHTCHNRWHAANDPDYDPNKPLKH